MTIGIGRSGLVVALVLLAGLAPATPAQQQATTPQATAPQDVKPSDGHSHPAPRVVRVICGFGPPPQSLGGMTRSADKIVIGRVTRVLDRVTTPPNVSPDSEEWLGNRTIFQVWVEQYLKGAGPRRIKWSQEGGEVEGVLYVGYLNPLPAVGRRYLLFLRSLEDDDELFLLGRECQVLLKGGRTHSVTGEAPEPTDPLMPEPMPLGVSEQEAIARIRRALAEPDPSLGPPLPPPGEKEQNEP